MSARILIVEDESIVRLDIKNRLQKSGYVIAGMTAYGEEAVKLAGESLPDVVLMDIQLKGAINGIEAAEQIRALYDIPVIYLTANADPKTLYNSRSTEPYGHIFKPFNDSDIVVTIEQALRKRQENATTNCCRT